MSKRKFIHNDHPYTRSKPKQLPNIRSQPKQLSIPFVHSDHSYVSSINKNNSNPVEKNDYIKGKPSYAQVLKSNLSQTECEPDISLLCEDGTSQTSPLCKKIYTAELISSPVQVHQSEDSSSSIKVHGCSNSMFTLNLIAQGRDYVQLKTR